MNWFDWSLFVMFYNFPVYKVYFLYKQCDQGGIKLFTSWEDILWVRSFAWNSLFLTEHFFLWQAFIILLKEFICHSNCYAPQQWSIKIVFLWQEFWSKRSASAALRHVQAERMVLFLSFFGNFAWASNSQKYKDSTQIKIQGAPLPFVLCFIWVDKGEDF